MSNTPDLDEGLRILKEASENLGSFDPHWQSWLRSNGSELLLMALRARGPASHPAGHVRCVDGLVRLEPGQLWCFGGHDVRFSVMSVGKDGEVLLTLVSNPAMVMEPWTYEIRAGGEKFKVTVDVPSDLMIDVEIKGVIEHVPALYYHRGHRGEEEYLNGQWGAHETWTVWEAMALI